MSLAKNVMYMLAGRWVYNLTTLATFSIIVTMITPSEFGVYTLASTFAIFSDLFFSDGVENLILKQKEETKSATSSFFWVAVAFSAILAAFVALVSVPFGWLYDSEQLVWATQAMCVVLLVQGAASVPRALLLRAGRSRQYATNSALSNLIGSVAGIIAAIKGFGIWALIVQPLVLQVAMLFLCSAAARYRPRLILDLEVARTFSYDLGVMLWSTILNVLGNRIDVFMIGYVFGEAATGVYGLAKRIVQILQDLVASSFDKIMLSMISRQPAADPEGLYRRSVFLQAAVAIPSFIGFAAISPMLIPAVFGGEWKSAAPLVALMAVGGIFRSMVTIERAQQLAYGQIKNIAHVRLVELFISVASSPLTWLGIPIVALAFSVRSAFGYVLVLNSRFGHEALLSRTLIAGKLISIPIFASATMAISVLTAMSVIEGVVSDWSGIAICVAVGIASFTMVMAASHRAWIPHLRTS